MRPTTQRPTVAARSRSGCTSPMRCLPQSSQGTRRLISGSCGNLPVTPERGPASHGHDFRLHQATVLVPGEHNAALRPVEVGAVGRVEETGAAGFNPRRGAVMVAVQEVAEAVRVTGES